MDKKVLLMILDGWGEGRQDESNVIYTQGAPYIESLRKQYPMSTLKACGEAVGLPEGQMGNSEVGHLNLGAGRVVYQDLVKINIAAREHKFLENAEIKAAYDYVKANNKQLHLMGLASMGGVHSSLEHVYEFLNVAKEYGLEDVFVHCFMDGRDTDPKSGKGFVEGLEAAMAQSTGKVATVCGRFYAMDRDKRWERVKEAYDMLVDAKGTYATSATEAIQASYDEGVTDEFIKPVVITDASGAPLTRIQEGDAVIFFNFRNDRARELTAVLTQQDMPEQGMHTIPLYYCCLTPYDASFTGVHILFDKENVQETLGEVVSKAGKNQLRIAETEKYAHVTFFFNGGAESLFENEDRILVNSPKVATYDLQPEMSAPEVAATVIDRINKDIYDLIILNFANPDMVGHTGVFEAAVKAIETLDRLVGEIRDAIFEKDGQILLTADHGNADTMLDEKGGPVTKHSTAKVPLCHICKEPVPFKKDTGKLADIAPTLLTLMGLEVPAGMEGDILV